MAPLPRPFPGLTGPGRRARWRRGLLRRAAAACCVAGAAFVGLHTVRPPPPPGVTVLVAARAVAPGAVLEPGDVAVRSVPLLARQPGAVTTTAGAVGRRVGGPLLPGEAVTSSRLVPRTVAEGLAASEVALHVLLADPAGVDLLVPGHRVTVYPTGGGEALATGARVLAVDAQVVDATTALGGGPPAGRGAVLALPGAAARAVLGGHGGLEGPPVVNVAVMAP
ncbi:SAF domain-containing protein [uncultured Phycicoccus sp.]|uniref:SAF domain-containing protein n=1 Tax=uncultured Phycicoccus sp. TaxID=661422 RepID=UPI00261D6840|nr:SAF domain-containing protein [uncultured Phycicoccus sp.]